MNNRPTIGLAAALIGGYLVLVGGDFPAVSLPDFGVGRVAVPDAPPLTAPTGPLLIAVQPLVGAVPNQQARAELAALHVCLAEAIKRDTENVNTTAKVRELNNRAGSLYYQKWGRSLDDEAPGVNEKMKTAMEAAMGGKENKALDAATRAKVVAAYLAVAWAFAQ